MQTVPLSLVCGQKRDSNRGYNVKVCRICFASGCNLYSMIKYKKLHQAYEMLTGLIPSNDNVPPYLCNECSYRLLHCIQFKSKSIQANLTLQEIVRRDKNLTLEAIESCSKYKLFSSKLSITHKPSDHYDLQIEHVETQLVRVGTKESTDPHTISVKVENDELLNENLHDNHSIHSPPGLHEVTLPAIKIEQEVVYTPDIVKSEITNNDYEQDDSQNTIGIKIKVEPIEVGNDSEICSDDNNIDYRDNTPHPNVDERYSPDQQLLGVQQKAQYTSSNIKDEVGYQKSEFVGAQEECDNFLRVWPGRRSPDSQSPERIQNDDDSKKRSGKKLYSCEVCKKTFSNRYHMSTHKRIHFGVKPYSCDVCNKQFNLKPDLANHLRKHTGEKPYVCNICDRSFILRNVLQTHMRTHTGERPYPCKLCDKAFTQRANLKAHIKTHSGEKPYTCDICQKSFSQRCNLLTHFRTHSGEKPFSCNLCKNTFSRNYQLKNHMLTHSGVKPYPCSVCNKGFNSQSNLQEHIAIHSGEKPFSCDICNKAFNRKSNLNLHIKTHSDEKPFPCIVCNKAFKRKDQLKKHSRIHSSERAIEVNLEVSTNNAVP